MIPSSFDIFLICFQFYGFDNLWLVLFCFFTSPPSFRILQNSGSSADRMCIHSLLSFIEMLYGVLMEFRSTFHISTISDIIRFMKLFVIIN